MYLDFAQSIELARTNRQLMNLCPYCKMPETQRQTLRQAVGTLTEFLGE